jgi:hypothetical protein
MDTENFLLKRNALLERLGERRTKDLSLYPFQMGTSFGLKFPIWARLALSLVSRGGILSSLMQVALPLAAPFFLKRQPPIFIRLFDRFFPSRS